MSASTGTAPSRGTMLWRGLTKRCARCGSGHLFRRYLKMVPDCPRCGLHFEREAGYFVGALAINIVCAGGLVVLTLALALILTVPDVPVVPIAIAMVVIGGLGPLVWFPYSKTLWVAIDRAFLQKLDRQERADEQHRR
jgi:uncharacterized protein (DUF983 family)